MVSVWSKADISLVRNSVRFPVSAGILPAQNSGTFCRLEAYAARKIHAWY
jgi:hypothetical protein